VELLQSWPMVVKVPLDFKSNSLSGVDGRGRSLAVQSLQGCRPLQPGNQQLLQAALHCHAGSGINVINIIVDCPFRVILIFSGKARAGNTKRGSIIVPLTSCFTGLGWSVLQIITKIVSCHTADSKPVKQEVNGTVILPPLVFPGQGLAIRVDYVKTLARKYLTTQ
jgi:hypothetical protein